MRSHRNADRSKVHTRHQILRKFHQIKLLLATTGNTGEDRPSVPEEPVGSLADDSEYGPRALILPSSADIRGFHVWHVPRPSVLPLMPVLRHLLVCNTETTLVSAMTQPSLLQSSPGECVSLTTTLPQCQQPKQ